MRTVLIDGDIILYKVAITNCTDVCWDVEPYDDIYTSTIDLNVARAAIDEELSSIQRFMEAEDIVMVFSSVQGNFRNDIYQDYKHNRKFKKKPVGYYELKKYVVENYTTYEEPKLEGDDLLGILCTSDIIKGEKVIWSEDKDLKTIPCKLGKWIRDDVGKLMPEVIDVSLAEADYNFLKQTLTGDTSDGYIGCRGIGGVKVTEILKPFEGVESIDMQEAWSVIVDTYISQKREELAKEDPEYATLKNNQKKEFRDTYDIPEKLIDETYNFAVTQARCAKILRGEDYDFTTKKFKLFTPEKPF